MSQVSIFAYFIKRARQTRMFPFYPCLIILMKEVILVHNITILSSLWWKIYSGLFTINVKNTYPQYVSYIKGFLFLEKYKEYRQEK